MKTAEERFNEPLKLTIRRLKTIRLGTIRIKVVLSVSKKPFNRSLSFSDFEIFTAKKFFFISYIDLTLKEKGIYSIAVRNRDMEYLDEQAAIKLTVETNDKLQCYSNIILINSK